MAAGALIGLAAFLVWDQSHWWGLRADYSFGYLVPVFVAFVVHDRWAAITAGLRAAMAAPPGAVPAWQALPGWLALAGGGAAFLLGALLRAVEGSQLPASQLLSWGFAALLLGTAWLLAAGLGLGARLRFTLLFLFPAVVWLISAPMISVLEEHVSLFLRRQVSGIVFAAFDFAGLPILQQGNLLVLPKGPVLVEEACSGIRSLTGCIFAGGFLAAVFVDRAWKKAALLIAAVVLAFGMNIVRSLFLTGWAYAEGPTAIEGTVHDVTGYAVLGLTSLGLLALLPLLNLRLPPPALPEETVNVSSA